MLILFKATKNVLLTPILFIGVSFLIASAIINPLLETRIVATFDIFVLSTIMTLMVGLTIVAIYAISQSIIGKIKQEIKILNKEKE